MVSSCLFYRKMVLCYTAVCNNFVTNSEREVRNEETVVFSNGNVVDVSYDL